MMTGHMEPWAREKRFFHPAFAAAFSFLTDTDLSRLPAGRYAVSGDDIFAVVQTARTEPANNRRFELHREHLDIQAVIRGQEAQGYYSLPPAGATRAPSMPAQGQSPEPLLLEDRLDVDDTAFYSRPERARQLVLCPGLYAVYLPFELHCPLCAVNDAPEDILKVVVKIHNRCF